VIRNVPKLVLNMLNVLGNSTFIYIPWVPNSRKFLKKLPIYMWPMCAHVRTMGELKHDWEWTKIQLKINLASIKSKLIFLK